MSTVAKTITVTHCRSSAARHGPERALLELAPALAALGIRTSVVALYRPPPKGPATHPWVKEMADAGFPAAQVRDSSPMRLGVVRRIAWELRQSGADILHTHDYKSNMLGGLAARRAERSLPWVATVHLHTQTTRRLRVYRAVDLLLLRLADRVITVSRDQRRLLLRRGVDRHRLALVPNVIDAPAFAAHAAPPEVTRRTLGLGSEERVVTLVGRLTRQKGIDLLIEAVPRIVAGCPQAHFLVVGNGAARPHLEEAAAAAGLGERVAFLGYRTDVASLMAASDVVALPSRSEGLPVAMLEAMAVGVPVVAAAVGGIPDLVRDKEDGWLVPPDRPDALAARLVDVLQDPGAARAMGEAGRRRVTLVCSPERAARRLANVYRAVLAERV